MRKNHPCYETSSVPNLFIPVFLFLNSVNDMHQAWRNVVITVFFTAVRLAETNDLLLNLVQGNKVSLARRMYATVLF